MIREEEREGGVMRGDVVSEYIKGCIESMS